MLPIRNMASFVLPWVRELRKRKEEWKIIKKKMEHTGLIRMRHQCHGFKELIAKKDWSIRD